MYPAATGYNRNTSRYEIWEVVGGECVGPDDVPLNILHVFPEGTTNDEACKATTRYQETGEFPPASPG